MDITIMVALSGASFQLPTRANRQVTDLLNDCLERLDAVPGLAVPVLIFGLQRLERRRTLAQYNIKQGATLQLYWEQAGLCLLFCRSAAHSRARDSMAAHHDFEHQVASLLGGGYSTFPAALDLCRPVSGPRMDCWGLQHPSWRLCVVRGSSGTAALARIKGLSASLLPLLDRCQDICPSNIPSRHMYENGQGIGPSQTPTRQLPGHRP